MKSFILTVLMSLTACFANVKDSSLCDISKPYLGEYECKRAQLGSFDCLRQFSFIRLELKDEENFTLYYQEKGEKKKEQSGKYRYDKERGVILLTDEKGYCREFPLSDGKLTVSIPVGGKQLILQFEQK